MNYLDYDGTKELIDTIKFLSNNNILINPNFKINQRDGYITKLGIIAYSDKELTTAANNSLAARYKIIERSSTYASYKSGDNIFYVNINDIEKGYCTDINSYTVDRWKFNDATSNTLLINDDYITLIGTGTDVINGLQQSVENYKDYAGCKLTFSAMVKSTEPTNIHMQIHDGVTYHILNFESTTEWKIISVTATMAQNISKLKVEIGIKKGYTGNINIKYAKLEQSDTFTPFIAPDFGSELMKCKRFYQRIGVIGNGVAKIFNISSMAVFPSSNLNYVDFYYELPQVMRAVPSTCNLYGKANTDQGYGIGSMNGNNPDGKQYTYKVKASESRFKITVSLDLSIEQLVYPDILWTKHLIFYQNCGVELDAEIYW